MNRLVIAVLCPVMLHDGHVLRLLRDGDHAVSIAYARVKNHSGNSLPGFSVQAFSLHTILALALYTFNMQWRQLGKSPLVRRCGREIDRQNLTENSDRSHHFLIGNRFHP